jgi:hypothetical protein
MQSKDKLLMGLSFAILALLTFLIFVAGWWILYPYKVLKVDGNPIPEHVTIAPGNSQHVAFVYCKTLNLRATVTRSLVCTSRIYNLGTFTSDYPVGCRRNKIDVFIPVYVYAPDECYIETSYHYDINPLRTITDNWHSEPFMVTSEAK